MRRWRGPVAGAVLATGLAAVLSGCSTTPDVDPEAAQQWITEQDSVEVPGSLASMSGTASPLSDDVSTDGITVSFEEPHPVGSLQFACFGPKTMSADVTMAGAFADGAPMTQTSRFDDLICDGELQTIDMAVDAATAVTANGLSTDARGAWAAFVVGEG